MKRKEIKISTRTAVNMASAIRWFIHDDDFSKTQKDKKELLEVYRFLLKNQNLKIEGE